MHLFVYNHLFLGGLNYVKVSRLGLDAFVPQIAFLFENVLFVWTLLQFLKVVMIGPVVIGPNGIK